MQRDILKTVKSKCKKKKKRLNKNTRKKITITAEELLELRSCFFSTVGLLTRQCWTMCYNRERVCVLNWLTAVQTCYLVFYEFLAEVKLQHLVSGSHVSTVKKRRCNITSWPCDTLGSFLSHNLTETLTSKFICMNWYHIYKHKHLYIYRCMSSCRPQNADSS